MAKRCIKFIALLLTVHIPHMPGYIHTYIWYMYIYTFKTFLCKLCKEFSVPTSIEQKQKKKHMDSDLLSETLVLLKMHQRLAHHEILWHLLLNSHCVPNVLTTRWFGIGVCGISFQLVLTFLWNRLPVFGPVFFSAERKGYRALVRYFCFRDYPKLMILVEKTSWSICPRCSLHGSYSIFIPLPILK